MDQPTVDWRTLVPSLVAQLNTVLMIMGVYHLPSDQANAVVAMVSSIIGLIGIILSHKRPTPPGNAP